MAKTSTRRTKAEVIMTTKMKRRIKRVKRMVLSFLMATCQSASTISRTKARKR